MIGILFVFGSSLAWVALDGLRKSIGLRVPAFSAAGAISGAQFPVFVVALLFGFGHDLHLFANPAYWAVAAPTVCINIVAGYLFVRAVQISPLGLTIPYLSFTPVFSALVAAVVLGQIPTIVGLLGIVIVVVGAVFLNPMSDGVFHPLRALRDERGSLYMLLVSMLWSVSPILDKQAVDMTSPFLHSLTLSVGIGVGCYLWVSARHRSAVRFFSDLAPIARGLLWFAAAANVIAIVLQLSAYAYLDVAYVETIKRAIGVLGAMVVGYRLFDERFASSAYFGAGLMVIGVALVLLFG